RRHLIEKGLQKRIEWHRRSLSFANERLCTGVRVAQAQVISPKRKVKLVDYERLGRVEALGENVVEQDADHLPESGALDIALDFQRHARVPRKFNGRGAVLRRKVGSKLADVARSHAGHQSKSW